LVVLVVLLEVPLADLGRGLMDSGQAPLLPEEKILIHVGVHRRHLTERRECWVVLGRRRSPTCRQLLWLKIGRQLWLKTLCLSFFWPLVFLFVLSLFSFPKGTFVGAGRYIIVAQIRISGFGSQPIRMIQAGDTRIRKQRRRTGGHIWAKMSRCSLEGYLLCSLSVYLFLRFLFRRGVSELIKTAVQPMLNSPF